MMSVSTVQVAQANIKIEAKVVGPGPGGTDRLIDKTNLKKKCKEESNKKAKLKRLMKSRKARRHVALTSNAPFNSTQFLMSDHGGDTIQYLDNTLGVNSNPSAERDTERPGRRVTRARESSFSLDSDEDFYYSSPEDEEEFVSQQFINEYNNVRTDRLVDMSKADLIQEYLQMEQRVDNLEKRLKKHKAGVAEEESNSTDALSEQIRLFQKEILRLEAENERLRSDNMELSQVSQDMDDSDSCSTCCSSDDGDDSSSSSSSSSDEDEEADSRRPAVSEGKENTEHESSQSVLKTEVSSSNSS